MIKRYRAHETWIERQAYYAVVMNAVFLMILGAWIGNPFTDSFAGRPSLKLMEAVQPEAVWGTLFFVFGVLKLISGIAGMYKLARASAFGIFLLWFSAAGCFFFGGGTSPTIIMTAYLAVQAGHHYIMINRKQNLPLESN